MSARTNKAEPRPAFSGTPKGDAEARVYVGDCRDVIPAIPECARGEVDLIFADPPFNWNRRYEDWDDSMSRGDYLEFTYDWLDACVAALAPHGALWVNIPDDTAAEIVVHLKNPSKRHGRERPALELVNWCCWHYRFGQNCVDRFINSKVHALYFAKGLGFPPGGAKQVVAGSRGRGGSRLSRVWNPDAVLEPSDRASIYGDPRTMNKSDGMPAGLRVPMDVWYGKYWGRIQGNNKERTQHDNQLPEIYLNRVIRACSNPGMLVMDPFLGSGTTGVVAHALGRRFVGIEYSKDTAERAWERLAVKGVTRPLDQLAEQSTAIFPKRKGLKASLHAKASPTPPDPAED